MAGPLCFALSDAPAPDRALLGGKGAGLVEMSGLGLPVPPAFIIGTPCGHAYLAQGALPAQLHDELGAQLEALEKASGLGFGDDDRPMLVSVRSGAPVSMPGMMDTVLNVGLTERNLAALGRDTGDEGFAHSCFERLLESFATTVRGISRGVVEEALLDLDAGAGAQERCAALLGLIEAESGSPLPDAKGQVTEAIEAVFRSWNSRRAIAYRKHKGISDEMGTAVVVQLMVFGNRGSNSGSGVAFTRDPSTGEPGAFGDFLFSAQGEDVVAGERDALPLEVIGERLPDLQAELERVFALLERDTRDLCEVEFTIEEGTLWVLQTRPGQRSGRAAVRVAVALADDGLISREEALERVTPEQLEAARAPVFGTEPSAEAILAQGLAASPGAVVGEVALDPERAVAMNEEGRTVILMRPTTSPVDLPGVIAAAGVVTGRGGRTSHAAVVARGMGRPAVCGVGDLVLSEDRRSASLDAVEIAEGDLVSVDGDRGLVATGALPLSPAEDDPILARYLSWLDNAPSKETHAHQS
ncbi:MAG: pyruvate, orthophosphate dikinase [Thermoleophilaceae bacterium]|nr:pyruvate, orthophosphate dikinase [Thermoleophilaceae bacterium]